MKTAIRYSIFRIISLPISFGQVVGIYRINLTGTKQNPERKYLLHYRFNPNLYVFDPIPIIPISYLARNRQMLIGTRLYPIRTDQSPIRNLLYHSGISAFPQRIRQESIRIWLFLIRFSRIQAGISKYLYGIRQLPKEICLVLIRFSRSSGRFCPNLIGFNRILARFNQDQNHIRQMLIGNKQY